MPVLAEASLTDAERRAVDRAVSELRRRFGERLRSVWLYGSRARREQPHAESDIDLLVVLDRRKWPDDWDVIGLVMDAAEAEGLDRLVLSAFTYGSDELAQRRKIKSFFIQEVDRDKIVLFGEP
jgi:predicted nucleotidyltransferase